MLPFLIGLVAGAAVVAVAAWRLLAAERRATAEKVELVRAAASGDAVAELGRVVEASRRADRGEADRRASDVARVVDPLARTVVRVEEELHRLQRDRARTHAELATLLRGVGDGLDGLRSETGSLVAALRRPEARGSWGEIQLRRVVELAGMVERCDFVRQETVRSGDGARLRPDVLVRLPGGRVVVIDAKAPLDAYLSAVEASDDEERARHLAAHARQVRTHVTQLASRGYQQAVEGTPEFVVLFLPSDAIFQAALAEDPGLLEHGVTRQVLVATPTTLIALLRAVHHGWRQEQLAESAREIAAAGRELHRRAGTFLGAFARMGRQLGSATAAYNDAVGSLEARVLPQLRRLEEAGAGSGALEEPARIDVPPRALPEREVA